MSDKLLSKNHCAPFAIHFDATEPEHPVNLRTAARVAADAVRAGLSGTVSLELFADALTDKAAAIHAVNHGLLGGDRLFPCDIGAMEPPPGDGKTYLGTGGGWVEYIAPENGGGIGESGTLDHSQLQNRDAADQHPQSAIQYLESDLKIIRDDVADLYAAKDTQETTDDGVSVWVEDKYYAPPKLLFGQDNNLYKALLESGAGTEVGPRDPVSEPVLGDAVTVSSAAATLPVSANWHPPVCGDGVLVTVTSNSNRAAYSEDGGKTWTAATLPTSGNWRPPVYGSGVFLTVRASSTNAAYSTDGGKTWMSATLPSSARWNYGAFGNGVFVVVADGSTRAAYSEDNGQTWTAATLPYSATWLNPTYGDGVFVAVVSGSANAAYSADGGKTWLAISLPPSSGWHPPSFGGGVFVTVAHDSDCAAYSTDGGKSWVVSALPIAGNWRPPSYGDGRFVIVANGSDAAAYSSDGGQTWTTTALPCIANWMSPAYGNGVFVVVADGFADGAYSMDGGKTWVTVALPSASNWLDPSYGDDAFITIGNNSANVACLTVDINYLPNCWKLVG